MGYIQGADRNQVILMPEILDDYVGADNEERAIDAFIDSLDIASMGFKAEPAKEGRPGYDFAVLRISEKTTQKLSRKYSKRL